MLNALIAIMGDTYDRVSETRIERGQQQRAELLVEYDAVMCARRRADGRLFPRWLHAIRSTLDDEDAGGATQEQAAWSGRLRVIKNQITDTRAAVEADLARVEAQIEANRAAVEAKLEQLLEMVKKSSRD